MSLLRRTATPTTQTSERVVRLPTNTYREAEGAKIQDIPDVSELAVGGGGVSWLRGRGWDYKVNDATNWGGLANTHVPAKIVTLMKDPGLQQRSASPVPFAAIQMPNGVKHRLMWDNNWLQLLHRNTFGSGDKQILRMMSGDVPIAIILTNKTANALFGKMKSIF